MKVNFIIDIRSTLRSSFALKDQRNALGSNLFARRVKLGVNSEWPSHYKIKSYAEQGVAIQSQKEEER